MKKFVLFLLCIGIMISLISCDADTKKADEYAGGFITAMLVRDESEMGKYLHPDYIKESMPDDDFYKNITENHFFTRGNSLDAIYAVGKSSFPTGVNEEQGERNIYRYTILSNELYYDVDIIIFENDNGYGITGVTFNLNTNLDLYEAPSEAK